MLKNNLTLVVVLIFFLLLLIPLLTFNFKQDRVSELEKRVLTNTPTFFDEGGLVFEDKNNIENWVQDNIGFRSIFVTLAASIKDTLFNKTPTQQVLIGKDNWLFYGLEKNLNIAYGTYPLGEKNLEKIAQNQINIYKELKSLGKEYVIVLPPSKVSIYPEKLYGNFTIRDTPVDIVADYLEEHTPVPVIRLKENLLQEKKHYQLYHKSDTHWTAHGLYVGYRSIIEQLNKLNFIHTMPIDVIWHEDVIRGDLTNFLVLPKYTQHIESIFGFTKKEKNSIENGPTKKYYNLNDKNFKIYTYTNNSAQNIKIHIYGDSMFGPVMPSMIAEHFRETTFFWTPFINFEDIRNINADIIMYELTERLIMHFDFWTSVEG